MNILLELEQLSSGASLTIVMISGSLMTAKIPYLVQKSLAYETPDPFALPALLPGL